MVQLPRPCDSKTLLDCGTTLFSKGMRLYRVDVNNTCIHLTAWDGIDQRGAEYLGFIPIMES